MGFVWQWLELWRGIFGASDFAGSPRSYVFRVANKDMTYAQQLKDYEDAVIQKRFEELSEEEVRFGGGSLLERN